MNSCEGWCGDYCTTGENRWVRGTVWEEPKWLCDRHYQIYKEAEGERSKRLDRTA